MTLKRWACTPILTLLLYHSLSAQTAPYALSPKWVFGNKAQFDFTGGGTPTQPARTDNIIANEGSSTLCDSLKNVTLFDNNVRVAGTNFTPLGSFMTASSSSDQGGVIIPNPANPYASYFIVAANAESVYSAHEANDQATQGLRVYSTNETGASVTAPALVSTLETNAVIKEYAYTSSNGNWGYWVVSAKITGGGNTEYYAWPIPASGTLGARVTSNGLTGVWNEQYQGAIKINRCQTRIALVQGSSIQVYNWNRTTGQVGTQIYSNIGAPPSKYYGCEFSPDGTWLYVSTLAPSPLIKIDLSSGTMSTFAGSASGSLQLGPNNVIYVANGQDAVDNNQVGTITNPNTGGTYNATAITLANSSTVRLGMSNIAWINPRKPTIGITQSPCGNYTMTPHFLTYFKDVISYTTAVWDFGDGSTDITNTGAAADDPVTHSYSTSGAKTVTLTLTDAVCGQTWVGTQALNVTCPLPVTLTNFTAVSNGEVVHLYWSTTMEMNNDYFEVQRSTDGVNFVTLGMIDGHGNSSKLIDYSFTDATPVNGTNYYRLVQHDFDGRSNNSSTLTVKINGGSFSVYPNPSEGEFNLNVSGAATIVVYDILGHEVYSAEVPSEASVFTFGRELAKGTYILKVLTAGECKSVKLEKK